MTADDFRDVILGLDGVIERSHMRHPDFRANGRIFASLSTDETIATVRLSPDEQAELLHQHPRTFFPAAGAWGRDGWTRMTLSGASEPAVRAAVLLAWQAIVAMKPGRSAAGRAPKRSTKKPPRKRR